jgi:hypothetical protein
MGRYARLAAAVLALSLVRCDYVQPVLLRVGAQLSGSPTPPALLTCRGDFGQFAHGFMVTRPMELNFAVDWAAPLVTPLDRGKPARIISLTPLELSFDVQYDGYKVAYLLNRVDGSFSQRPNLGGVFSGTCETKPLDKKF